jgi:spermidine synthase
VTEAWVELGRALTADGDELRLRQRGPQFELRMNGWELMGSRAHRSEDAMAALACERLPQAASVLVGGLGMGYTLRAVLDLVSREASVLLVELVPEIVMWNRGVLGSLAGRPLDDPRVTVEIADVADVLHRSANAFDAIVLDIDNGPHGRVRRSNALLGEVDGLRVIGRSLRPGCVLAVWSAEPSSQFEAALAAAGFAARSVTVAATQASAVTHTIYLGRTTPD